MLVEAEDRLYGGLDLHKRNVYCAIVNQAGKAVYTRRLPAELSAVLQELEPYRQQLESIAVESTYNWYWLVDGLEAAEYGVRLANPSKMGNYNGLKQSNDKTDALWIAEMLRLGVLPQGYIYPKAVRPVRDALRRRMLVTQQATQTVLSLQSMLMRQTGRSVSASKLEKWTSVEFGDAFSDPHSRSVAIAMRKLLGQQRQVQKELEQQVLSVMKLDGGFRRLLSVPGIGQVLGLTIALETGPIERFPCAGNYASYCRMVGSRCESDGKKKGENNRKNGNRYLSWAYIEAANFAARFNVRAKGWLDRKQSRTSRVVAVKALGCKLSKAVYYVLRDGAEFQEEKLFG